MAMPTELVTEVTALQIPSQPVVWHGKLIVLATGQVLFKMDHLPSPVGPSSQGCKPSPVTHGLDVALVLVALAGLLILVLLYHILLLRHKLRMAQAGNALEYFGFYHTAHYTLKELNVNPVVTPPEGSSPPALLVPPPSPAISLLPTLPPSPSPTSSPPSPPPPPPPSLMHPSHPIIYTTPPSPQLDAVVYSHIGALRPSRLSGVSQLQVVLFEHTCL